ncbi:hypothetical protein MMC09_001180 [Bachmanniomyces sp. S44760]|nr:hypothetical protein [Bachmanniomyces sp. S44760]
MNTIRSTWIGWGVLIIGPPLQAGGGSYYFAKKSVNADRAARHEEDLRRRRLTEHLEFDARSVTPPKPRAPRSSGSDGISVDHAGRPSNEASLDPAPISHAPQSEKHAVRERSKYEASEPYRAKKGDRFS